MIRLSGWGFAFINIVIGIINVLGFGFLFFYRDYELIFSEDKIRIYDKLNNSNYIEYLSLQITTLEFTVVLLGIAGAIGGFFGYQQIKDQAVSAAMKTIQNLYEKDKTESPNLAGVKQLSSEIPEDHNVTGKD